MTPTSREALTWLREQVEQSDGDLLREMVRTVAQGLMDAQASALRHAEYGERTAERTNQRNGDHSRRWDTRVGTLEVAIPKLRKGSYFPEWLLEPRRRAERALLAVIAECYRAGVSTRRVEGLVQTLGIASLSKFQVLALARSLDDLLTAFRNRPLDSGPYTSVWVDALTQKAPRRRAHREHGDRDRHRRQCGWPPRNPGGGRDHDRGWRGGLPSCGVWSRGGCGRCSW